MSKRVLCLLLILVLVLSGCGKNNKNEEETCKVTIIVEGVESSIEVVKGMVLQDASKLNIPDPVVPDGLTFDHTTYIDQETGEPFEFSKPIEKDVTIIVSYYFSTSAIPVPVDGGQVIEVTAIDVPIARYEQNGVRYKVILKPGANIKLEATITPDNATDKSVYYYIIDDNGVCSVKSDGVVTANKYGFSMVHVSASNGINVGVLVVVEGYDIKVTNESDGVVYYLSDEIELKYEVTSYIYGEDPQTTDKLPSGTFVEIVEGEDVLEYDESTGTVKVIKSPTKEQTIKFRLVHLDDYGEDLSDIIEIKVGKQVN